MLVPMNRVHLGQPVRASVRRGLVQQAPTRTGPAASIAVGHDGTGRGSVNFAARAVASARSTARGRRSQQYGVALDTSAAACQVDLKTPTLRGRRSQLLRHRRCLPASDCIASNSSLVHRTPGRAAGFCRTLPSLSEMPSPPEDSDQSKPLGPPIPEAPLSEVPP